MGRFSILTAWKDDYNIARQMMESIFHFISKEDREQIIIVDDFSPLDGKIRAYEKYLEQAHGIKVISFDEYRHVHYYAWRWFQEKRKDEFFDYSKFSSENCSLGHLLAIDEGLKLVDSEFVLVMDMDAFFTSKAKILFHDLVKLFDGNPEVMMISDTNGIKSFELQIFSEIDNHKVNIYGRKPRPGYTGSPITAIRMSALRKHNIMMTVPTHSKQDLRNDVKFSSAIFENFCPAVYEAGFLTMHYPIIGSGMAVHLGRSVIKRTNTTVFPFMKEWSAPYGSRLSETILDDWRCGRFAMNMKQKEYEEYLQKKFEAPFEQVQAPIDETLLAPIDADWFEGFKLYPEV